MESGVTGRLIGVVGRAGSGKDTIGNILLGCPARLFSVMSFATPIKMFCKEVFAFSHDQLWGPSEMRNTPDPRYPRADGTYLSPREALQKLGTEWGRSCYPNIWAELGVARAKEQMLRGHSIVFTDCRFINEAEAIRAADGQVWRVYRPEAEAKPALHESEREMNSPEMAALVTHAIVNDGTLEDLKSKVGNLL